MGITYQYIHALDIPVKNTIAMERVDSKAYMFCHAEPLEERYMVRFWLLQSLDYSVQIESQTLCNKLNKSPCGIYSIWEGKPRRWDYVRQWWESFASKHNHGPDRGKGKRYFYCRLEVRWSHVRHDE